MDSIYSFVGIIPILCTKYNTSFDYVLADAAACSCRQDIGTIYREAGKPTHFSFIFIL